MAKLIFALALLSACGTRTGLEIGSDSGTSRPDGRVDAARRDSGPDGRVDAGIDLGVTGTWIATDEDGSVGGAFTLHQRADGRVIGTVLGGTSGRLMGSARLRGDTLEITYLQRNPMREMEMTNEGTVGDGQIRWIRRAGGGTRVTTWERAPAPLVELRWLLRGVELSFEVELDVVLLDGGFLSGGVLSRVECSPFPCAGSVLAYRDEVMAGARTLSIEGESSGQTFSLLLSGGGVGPLTGRGELLFEDGRFESHAVSAELVAATRSDDAAQLFSALAEIADARENGVGLDESLPISPRYRHDGLDRRSLLDAFGAERDLSSSLSVDVSEIRQMQTRDSMLEPSAPPVGLHFRERVTGISESGVERVISDVDTTEPGGDRLRLFVWEGGTTLLVFGNQAP